MNEKDIAVSKLAGAPRLLCRCSQCNEHRELPLPLTKDNVHAALLPWVFTLIDPPVIASPRTALICEPCAKRIYGGELYEEAVASIKLQATKPN